MARSLALLASYAAVSGSIFLAAWVVRATLRQWKFEAFDRHLGMLLGGVEGAIVGLVVTLFVVSLAPQMRAPILTSPTGHVVCKVLDTFEPVMPAEIRAELAPFWTNPDDTATAARTVPDSITQSEHDSSTPERAQADAAAPGSEVLRDLIKEGESQVGRALNEATKNGVDWTRDRGVERR